MHDIGKIGIPDAILKKPGKLDQDEITIMKTHAEMGFSMLKHSTRPILKTAAIIAHQHHEKWDGSGYPQQLIGDEIHIYGRITAIFDVLDVLVSVRVYKKAWPLEEVLALFKEQRGIHFDPALVDLLLDNLPKFLEIREKHPN
jgi:response regulator RpfG family c-di-GMP phosphodiesterase